MISCSRWYSSDGSTFYIRLSGDYPSNLTMRHFNNEGEAVDFKLAGDGPTFSYEIGELEPLDAWRLLSGSTVIAAHGDPDNRNSDDHSMSLQRREEMPKGPFDDMRVETFTFNKYAHLLVDDEYLEEDVDYSSYKLTTATPALTNKIIYEVTVEDELRLASMSHYAPRQVSQDELDDLLSDPQELFESGSGEALLVGDNIVVPYSDGETTWTKSYVKADVYSVEDTGFYDYELVKAEPVTHTIVQVKERTCDFDAIVGKLSFSSSSRYETEGYYHVPVDNSFMSDGMIFMREW